MIAGDLILMARRRAALTQRELASRLGYRQATIARWERGDRQAAFQDVEDVAAACGLRLDAHLFADDKSWWPQIATQLELPPIDRVRRLTSPRAYVRIEAALQLLAEASDPMIVIGDVAGALRGWPLVLGKPVVEVCARSGAVENVVTSPRSRDEAVSSRTRGSGERIQLTETPSGTAGYGDLIRGAEMIEVNDGSVLVAGLRDLVRIADASTDPGAWRRALAYQAVLDVQREQQVVGRPADLRTDDERIEAWLGQQISAG